MQPGVFTGSDARGAPAWPLLRRSVARMETAPETPELPLLRQEEDMWILRVEANGKVQEYRCGSEVQARALAILLLSAGGDAGSDGSPPSLS